MEIIELKRGEFTAINLPSRRWIASFEDGYLIVSHVSFGSVGGGEDNQGSTVSAVCEIQ